MTDSKSSKYAAGFGLSLFVSSILSAVILLVKETNDSVMNAMKAALGHHWTTHGAIVIAAFIVLGFIFSSMKLEEKIDDKKLLRYIIWAVIISVVVCFGFYLPGLKIATGKAIY